MWPVDPARYPGTSPGQGVGRMPNVRFPSGVLQQSYRLASFPTPGDGMWMDVACCCDEVVEYG